ncbi:MAG: FGGY-family carbohydrate kinase [Pseudomonadota bacterium]
MSEAYLLGVDSGLTVTKAVIFDLDGREIGVGRATVPQLFPMPGHVERDMDALWLATAEAVRSAKDAAAIPGAQIAAIGITGHGDGLYLLEEDGQPLGNAILSLDSRAIDVVDDWEETDLDDRSLALTGQRPHPAAPSALLAWIKRYETDRYAKIRHVITCKDWLRYCLTGEIATDPTEASASFTNVRTQGYDPAVLSLFDLDDVHSALPKVLPVTAIAGTVSSSGARETGLAAGTPVVTGLHDVTATAVGMGCVNPGQIALVAGTYSINETLLSAPALDARWLCRNGFRPGEWNAMAISPASSANTEWVLHQFCRDALDLAEATGTNPFDHLQEEIAAAFERDSRLIYHPFLFGSPYGDAAGGLIGLHGWHQRGDVLRAVFEGIAFNHRHHVDALRSIAKVSAARLAGGGAQNPLFAQLFADALGLEIDVVDHDEAGALGAALAAGVGVGSYASIEEASARTTRILNRYLPDPARHKSLTSAYRRYSKSIEQVAPLWPELHE